MSGRPCCICGEYYELQTNSDPHLCDTCAAKRRAEMAAMGMYEILGFDQESKAQIFDGITDSLFDRSDEE